MNTGAIARGYRPSPYPEDFLIKEINRLGKGIIITADCHNKDYLNCHFDESIEILKANGVGEVYTYSDGKFVPNPLY
jgi:histidinol-phosphatase (PHP family)